jgi:hypothetical protein
MKNKTFQPGWRKIVVDKNFHRAVASLVDNY